MATRLEGKVKTLIADRAGAFIELDNDPKLGPKGNIWQLAKNHENYNALYSLALAAAANRWPLTIRIAGDNPINISEDAGVKSFGVAF
jgi:hypothetical protein